MSAPHPSSRYLSKLAAVACACLLVAGARAATAAARQQQPEPPPKLSRLTALGIRQLEQGNTSAAILTLCDALAHDKQDADAWYNLGRAYGARGAESAAGDAYKRAVELRPALADGHVEVAEGLLLGSHHVRALAEAERALALGAADTARLRYVVARAQWLKCPAAEKARCRSTALEEVGRALAHDSAFAPAQLLKGHLLSEQDPAAAAESLEAYLSAAPDDLDAAVWREQVEMLRDRAVRRQPTEGVFKAAEVSQRAKIVSRPEPMYTELARQAGVSGTVTLTVVLGADGEVGRVTVLDYLSHGLTEQAARAVRKVKFEPAVKDGRPVSQYVTLQYNFNVY